MADLFSTTEVKFGGGMTSKLGMIVSNNGLSGVMMQNIQLQYQQQVTRLYELGVSGQQTNVYYVAGRSQGSMSAAHVIGPGVSMMAFYTAFSNPCNARNNQIDLNLTPNLCSPGAQQPANQPNQQADPAQASNLKYSCKYCVLVGIGVGVQAQDFIVNESSQLMFSALDFTG